jgi:hypothetical protein
LTISFQAHPGRIVVDVHEALFPDNTFDRFQVDPLHQRRVVQRQFTIQLSTKIVNNLQSK